MSYVTGLGEPAFALILSGLFALLITLFLLLMYIDGKRNARELRKKKQLLRAFRPGAAAETEARGSRDTSFTLDA